MSKHWDGDEYVGKNIGTIRILHKKEQNGAPVVHTPTLSTPADFPAVFFSFIMEHKWKSK